MRAPSRLVGYLASFASASLIYLAQFVLWNRVPDSHVSIRFRLGIAVFFWIFWWDGCRTRVDSTCHRVRDVVTISQAPIYRGPDIRRRMPDCSPSAGCSGRPPVRLDPTKVQSCSGVPGRECEDCQQNWCVVMSGNRSE